MPNDPPGFAAHLAEDLSPEDFVQVLILLHTDIEQLVAALETAAMAGDPKACRAAAHSLAGAAGSVGADRLAQVSRRAMTNLDPAAPLLAMAAEIRSVANATLRQIADFLAAGAPPAAP
jgi:HPt (histidine-containing phosphotransfer) domain-containing protein